ncbi:transient-receptor-potential-like protein isoform X2 [Corticium candelabrum]|uniref:transient-receptor-potential-like protein isoform X2 n=1 Tax=Corticium candelabrum TaxID=121492 RepID=UPI002E2692D6|nr:transient-receptor-potential-like protein isoform X2 [Corticium candelabrum]
MKERTDCGTMHILLNGGASVNIKDNMGQTVVHLAAIENMPFHILFPLFQKCSIHELSVTAVHDLMSTACLNVDMLVALCQSDVNLLSLGKTNLTAIHQMITKHRPTNALLIQTLASERSSEFNRIKDDLLLYTCMHGDKETLQALVQLGASTTGIDTVFELPAVLLAASSPADKEAVEKVKILLANGANIHVTSSNGQNLCHIAALMRNANLVELAIAARVDHTYHDKEGSTPLHYACSIPGNGTVISLLIEAGLGVHEPNSDGFTPLNLSIRSKDVNNIIPLIKVLVDFERSRLTDCLFQDLQMLAQPEVIAASHKPVEYALILSSFYERMARVQPRLKTSFMALSVQLEEAAIDMVEGQESSQLQALAVHADVVEMAILTGRKKFIATDAVQHELLQVWQEYINPFVAFIVFLLQTIARPFVISVLWPLIIFNIRVWGHSLSWDIIRPHAAPMTRYRVEAFAYVVFVILLLQQTAALEFSKDGMTDWAWITLVYVLALLHNEVVSIVREGFRFYFTRNGHKRSCFTIVMFVLFYGVRLAIVWDIVESTSTIYRLSSYLMAGALILACTQLLRYLRVHPLIGPIQKSFRKVQKSLVFFIIILFLYLLAFASGLVTVYGATTLKYNETQRQRYEENCPSKAFGSLPSSLLTLFLSLFGLIDYDALDNCSHLEEIFGKILFGLWIIQALIILLNMLIALVTNKFDEVQNNADIEWKFSFGATVIDVRKCQRYPIPFNLLHIHIDVLEWLFNKDNFMKRRFALLSISNLIRSKSGRRNVGTLQIDVFRKAEERKTYEKAATKGDVADINKRLIHIETSLSSVCTSLNIQSKSESTMSTLDELRRDSWGSYRQRLNTLANSSEWIEDMATRVPNSRDQFRKTLIHKILKKTESTTTTTTTHTNPKSPAPLQPSSLQPIAESIQKTESDTNTTTYTNAKSPVAVQRSPLQPIAQQSRDGTAVAESNALTQALISLQRSVQRQESTLLQIEARLANLENQERHREGRYAKPATSLQALIEEDAF